MRSPSAPATPQTLGAAFDEAAASETGGAIFFGRQFGFAELASLVDALASGLDSHGVGRGDRVIVQLQNSIQFVITALAVWRQGGIVVPVSPMYQVREARKISADSGAVVWVTDPTVFQGIGAEVLVDSSIRLVVTTSVDDFGGETPAPFLADSGPVPQGTVSLVALLREYAGARVPAAEVKPDDVAILTYTSGTTGMPKGALTTHANVLWVGREYARALGVDSADAVCLATAPLVHITGLAMHLGPWLQARSTLVLGYRFDSNYYLDLIETHRVTWSAGTATAFISLIDAQTARARDLRSLRVVACGGAPIPSRLIGEVRTVLGVRACPGYGLTESTGAITTTPHDREPVVDRDRGVVSVGPPMGAARVSIRDDEGLEVAAGQQGEICIRGDSVISGYWNNAAATAEAFRDGWLRTGDSGHLDENGWLFVVDRTKDMIIASGYKVWPREVEDVVYRLPAVREAAVVGVPDAYRGENVKVYVSLRPGHRLSEADLRAHCRAELAAYKVPRLIEFLDEIPKNSNGKILHRELRDRAAAEALR